MNVDLTETSSITCIKCWRGASVIWIKPVHWSRYGSCHTKLPGIDFTVEGSPTNSYSSISQAAQTFNIQGFYAYDAVSCPIATYVIEFVDYPGGYGNIASVPGLTETTPQTICDYRGTAGNCDGASDLYLDWASTVSYAALRIRQKVTFTTWNTAGTTKDNTLTFTSQIATFKIEVCEGVTLTSSLASSYSL